MASNATESHPLASPPTTAPPGTPPTGIPLPEIAIDSATSCPAVTAPATLPLTTTRPSTPPLATSSTVIAVTLPSPTLSLATHQSTKPEPGTPPAPAVPASTGHRWYSRFCNGLEAAVDKCIPSGMRSLWQHPAGPKTVFFWAPMFKWGLVIAGLSDLARPAESLSVLQCIALAATGLIWSRYSLVIIPKNYALFTVNLFVGVTQVVQLARAVIFRIQQSNQNEDNPG